jgi:hypothetical protein
MPIELQVIRASEFVRLDADEHLDFEATRQALQSLAHACWKRGVGSAVMDLRGLPVLAKPHFTATQLAALVGTFRDAGFSRQQRLAILYRHDIHGGIRDFAFFSRLRGMQVHAFSEFEAAMQWLAEAAQSPIVQPEAGATIPIGKPSTKAKRLPVSVPMRDHPSRQPRAVRHTRN